MENPTVQDIFHSFYLKYLDRYTPSAEQTKVSHCIMNCKTGAYGANVSVCEDCGHLQIHYLSLIHILIKGAELVGARISQE